MWPLYAAGFTTAFGAHAVAANLGAFSDDAVQSLMTLGVLLALYDGAEVLLKPVFGILADRIGARPVLIAGLVGFSLASATYAVADQPGWLWAARLGQGAAASAFSPSASALVARLNPAARHGRVFGSYGFYKSIGYTLGPLLGGVLSGSADSGCCSWSWRWGVWPWRPGARSRSPLCHRSRGPGRPWSIWPVGSAIPVSSGRLRHSPARPRRCRSESVSCP